MPNTETIDLYTLLTFLDDLARGAAWGGAPLRISDPCAQPPIICRWSTWHSGPLTLRLDPDRILPEHLPALQSALHTLHLTATHLTRPRQQIPQSPIPLKKR